MERLTKRNSLGIAVYKHPFECDRCGEPIYRIGDDGNGSPTDKLADYEDAEENGLLLRLPCKMNEEIHIIANNEVLSGTANFMILALLIERYGNQWFKSKEEAEAKLAEMRGDNNG